MSHEPAPVLQLIDAGYRYPAGGGMGPCTLDVAAGELVLLTGPTGCGKSTLLRLCAGLVQRHGRGEWFGEIRVSGEDPARLVAGQRVRRLGFVAQEPDDQVIAGTVSGEIRFGLENAGFPDDMIDRRVQEVMDAVGLGGLGDRPPMTLSGGQRQRLVIGAALAAGARLLLLDEPLAQLDPEGAERVMALLRAVTRTGVGVLMVEHRLEVTMPRVDRTVLMDGGRIVEDPLRGQAPLRAVGLAGPARTDLTERLGPEPWRARVTDVGAPDLPPSRPRTDRLIHLECVSAGWSRTGAVLHGVDLDLARGERVAVLGANGAGKSTLLALIAGRIQPSTGTLRRPPRVHEVPQNPDLVLYCETVAAELAYGPAAWGLPDVATRVRVCAEALSVDTLLERPPQSLSRGQRLRVAVASMVSCGATVLALDEPTSGQDREQVERMFTGLAAALPDALLLFATHDVDVALRHATRILVLDQGRLVADIPARVDALAPALTGLPVLLPPLAVLCLRLGVAYGTVEEVAAQLVPEASGGPA